MENKEKYIKLYLAVIVPLGIVAVLWAVGNFPLEQISISLAVLSIVTVFFGSYLRIQLPHTKIHLTVSDALIILSLLIYGGEVAVLLASFECFFTTLNLRRKAVNIKNRTILLNVAVAAFSTFVTAIAVKIFFLSPPEIVAGGTNTEFIILLTVMAVSQFVVNSICVAVYISLKSEKTIWQIWNEYCLNALVIYVAGALIAGLSVKALNTINMFLFAAIIAFSALIYITYKRYVNAVKNTAAKAEQSERERAEQAEKHIGELQHHIAEQERISDALRESKDLFRHAAFHDGLTNLPNRNQFIETLKFLLQECKEKPDFKFAVLFLDLDRFKTVNDSLGHSTGDRLIKHVAERLAGTIYEGDLVARFSGDEFAIIVQDVRDASEMLNFAELIKHKISSPFIVGGRKIFTSVSIGIALGNSSYTEAEEILRDADIAMYHAKESGKDYVIFDKMMHTRAVTRMQLETDLRMAVERDEFCVYYQPIIDLSTMRLAGFEALMRWNHPVRGLVPPVEFIPVCEDTGLIIPVTLWILRESCNQLVNWKRQFPNSPLMMSVNLSGKHFTNNDLVAQISDILSETGINPADLKLELTESAVMENAERVISMLRELKNLGVQLSIDDFGTGYSSLSYLHRFPIDTLKVDRSFVSEMETGSENGEIVRTIISLAKTLRMNVVAEGIESIHQIHQLQILGCEYGQGFLFSRPVPRVEAEKLLEDMNRWQNILPNQISSSSTTHEREIVHLRLAN
ncbi:MAG: EAL domain-containing protein [Acidobacteriota bacterium]|nr:EAL domain-containing protein [Acidobacteriota bacterium]